MDTHRTPESVAAMIIVGSNAVAVPTFRVFDLDTKVTLMHDVSEVTNDTMDTKSTLVIRNFPEDTKRILKTMAYQLGVPLHHLVNQVILKGLDAPGTAKAILGDRSKGNEEQQPEVNGKAEDHRAEELPRPQAAPVVKRRSGRVERVSASLAGMPGACVCTHPRKDHFQGQSCIQCPCPRFEEAR